MSGLGLFIMGGLSLTGLFLVSGTSSSGLGLLIIGGDSLPELSSRPEAVMGALSLGGLSLVKLCTVGNDTGLFLSSGTSISGLGLLIIGGESSPELSSIPEAATESFSPMELIGLLAKGWKLTGPFPCLGEQIGLVTSFGELIGLLTGGDEAGGLLASLGEPSGLLAGSGGLLVGGEELTKGFGEEGLLELLTEPVGLFIAGGDPLGLFFEVGESLGLLV